MKHERIIISRIRKFSNMDILVDLTYIHSEYKLRESVALYAFKFLRNLREENKCDFTLLILPEMKEYILERVGHYKTLEFKDLPPILLKIPYVRGLLRNLNWKRQIRKTNFDCIYLPFSWTGNSGKTNYRKIITIHDLRPMRVPDRAFTQSRIFQKTFLKSLYKSCCKYYYEQHIKNAHCIISISRFIKNELILEWPDSSDKIHTIYNSVDLTIYHPRSIETVDGKNFILYVNTLNQYKNIITLIKAFHNLLASNRELDYYLVVVGKSTEYWENEIMPFIKETNMMDKILHIKYATNEELKWLYGNANIFVSTSLHEGFGYTPIEAAISKCPVITTRCDSLPDVTAEKVFYYEPPTSERELEQLIKKIIISPPDTKHLDHIANFFKNRYSITNQTDNILMLLYDTKLNDITSSHQRNEDSCNTSEF